MNPSDWIVPGGPGIYIGPLELWKDAFNPAPIFGAAALAFGIINVVHGKNVAGWVQIGMGLGAIVFGILVH